MELSCSHGEAVKWNSYNKVVQCHSCGQLFVPCYPRYLHMLADRAIMILGRIDENNPEMTIVLIDKARDDMMDVRQALKEASKWAE
jgi:hypothetical protein